MRCWSWDTSSTPPLYVASPCAAVRETLAQVTTAGGRKPTGPGQLGGSSDGCHVVSGWDPSRPPGRRRTSARASTASRSRWFEGCVRRGREGDAHVSARGPAPDARGEQSPPRTGEFAHRGRGRQARDTGSPQRGLWERRGGICGGSWWLSLGGEGHSPRRAAGCAASST